MDTRAWSIKSGIRLARVGGDCAGHVCSLREVDSFKPLRMDHMKRDVYFEFVQHVLKREARSTFTVGDREQGIPSCIGNERLSSIKKQGVRIEVGLSANQ